MIDLSGKTAIVTGASRGIGRAVAMKLAACGANVIVCARGENALQNVAQEILAMGGKADAMTCDVADFNAVQAMVDQVVARYGKLDILVNNAGVIEPLSTLHESDPALWSRAIDINVKGVYHGLRAALPQMIAQGAGTIVNMSSGAANSALTGWSHYASSKAAARKLTETAHTEAHGHGVAIIGLSPGTVATEMMAKIRDAKINVISDKDWSVHSPPEHAAEAVAFLCGPQGAAFSGTDFSIKTPEGRKLVGLPL